MVLCLIIYLAFFLSIYIFYQITYVNSAEIQYFSWFLFYFNTKIIFSTSMKFDRFCSIYFSSMAYSSFSVPIFIYSMSHISFLSANKLLFFISLYDVSASDCSVSFSAIKRLWIIFPSLLNNGHKLNLFWDEKNYFLKRWYEIEFSLKLHYECDILRFIILPGR